MKELGLSIGLAAVTVAPFAILIGLAAGGVALYKKLKEKGPRVAGDIGQEGTWDFLHETENDYWDSFGC